ncbi:uncharacterized protein PV09_05332 [Verruconis gallopava]|uniref:Zn(2)-C6 fungal-type domain-containing protein n=1 Tax=Verruconis gallopava TaxID=253628 RepID=A0A0D1YSJ0_9PEZI|nr:uncharacterized protein PV09_05332 [Verruconis gallopava]KIW03577.1 hypothetical protein PV09_05332 [Verruconis gallopava]
MSESQDAPTVLERDTQTANGESIVSAVNAISRESVPLVQEPCVNLPEIEMTEPQCDRIDNELIPDAGFEHARGIKNENYDGISQSDDARYPELTVRDSAENSNRAESKNATNLAGQVVDGETIEVIATSKRSLKTHAIKPYSTLEPEDTVDLVSKIQTIFEMDTTVKENGVVLLDAPHLIPADGDIRLPPADYGFEATSQRVMTPARLLGTGLVVIKREEAILRDQQPKFSPAKELSEDDMERIFRDHIEMHGRNSKRFPYFNIDISDYRVRPEGSFELTCGAPMDKLSYIAGVNTPYGYYSRGISHFGAHVEDWHFASYNVLFAGQVKLWIAVKPSSKALFERKIRELFPEIGTCVQFVRHLAINIAPATLRKWGVEHFFVPQKPGQIVAVSGYTYHWGINTGQNYAEAINFCIEKNWVAPEEFKNCYRGCGIADDMIPLPKPVLEDGDLETKKERAIVRDQAFRKTWEEEGAKLVNEQDILSANKRLKPRKQSETPSESMRFFPARARPHLTSRDTSATPFSHRQRPRAKQRNTLRDSIEVSAAAQRLNGREYHRRTKTVRQRYRDASATPSEPSESTDEEPAVKRDRPGKTGHSRHISSILESAQQDSNAVATQINGLKNMVLSFLIDQKKAASEATAKQEQLMRLHVDWQIKQTEIAMKQSEYAQKMMESQQRMEHLTMLMLQKLESQQISRSDSTTTASNKQARGHSRFSKSVGGAISTNISSNGIHLDDRQNLPRHQLPFNAEGPVTSSTSSSRPLGSRCESLLNAAAQPDKASSGSNVTSRAPSIIGSSARATEPDTHTSPEYLPSTPQPKSAHSTPLADDLAPQSPASRLLECASHDITTDTNAKASDTRRWEHSGNDASDTSSLTGAEAEQGDNAAPEGSTRMGRSTAVSVNVETTSSVNKMKCTSCRARRVTCGKEEPACLRCITSRKPRTCIYPSTKIKSRTVNKQAKRAASEAEPCPSDVPFTKRSKTNPKDAVIERAESSSSRPLMTRELSALFNTDEWDVVPDRASMEPIPRKRLSIDKSSTPVA